MLEPDSILVEEVDAWARAIDLGIISFTLRQLPLLRDVKEIVLKGRKVTY